MVLVIDSSQGILGRFLISASTNTVDIRVWEKLRPHMPEKAWSQFFNALELPGWCITKEIDFGHWLARVVVPDTQAFIDWIPGHDKRMTANLGIHDITLLHYEIVGPANRVIAKVHAPDIGLVRQAVVEVGHVVHDGFVLAMLPVNGGREHHFQHQVEQIEDRI